MSIQAGMAQTNPAMTNCHQRTRRSFQKISVRGKPKTVAVAIATGNPKSQYIGNAHQIVVPFTSPTPQVEQVAAVTPITAEETSVETGFGVVPIGSEMSGCGRTRSVLNDRNRPEADLRPEQDITDHCSSLTSVGTSVPGTNLTSRTLASTPHRDSSFSKIGRLFFHTLAFAVTTAPHIHIAFIAPGSPSRRTR